MRIQIEIIDFEESCRHKTVIADKRKNREGEALLQHPTIVLVSGKGVITKSYEQDKTILQRVESNDTLYYSCDHENKTVSFVRNELVDCEIALFSKIITLKICSKVDDLVIGKVISEFYGKTFTVKHLLRYQEDSKIILSHLIKKVEIPLLISVFVLLLVNFFVNAHFSKLNNSLQMELMNNKRTVQNTDVQLKDIQKLKTESAPIRSMYASILIDRLASHIPDGITVHYFAVDPLKRKVENRKPLNIETHTVRIKGETQSANDITLMTTMVENLDFAKQVKIKNITQKQDETMLEFEIEITY